MAKIKSMWLKGAKGKVAGSTIYNSNGETIIRSGSSDVKNPQSSSQMIQRVIAKTVMNQYSALQPIVNHSFQGITTGSKSMNRFLSLNMNAMRKRAASIQAHGGSLYEYYQFTPLKSSAYTPTSVIISEGKLPRVSVQIEPDGSAAFFNVNPIDDPNTYENLINSLGLKRGDQLTFVLVEKRHENGDYIPHFARVILDPRNVDGTAAPLSVKFELNDIVEFPNARNEGAINIELTAQCRFWVDAPVAAAGVIVSRKQKTVWLRSYCKLALSEYVLGEDAMSLLGAVDASVDNTEITTDSTLYLNNSGNGGVQGESEGIPEPPYVLNNNVKINNVTQDISGGSVSVNPLNSLTVYGSNLGNVRLLIVGLGAEGIQMTVSSDETSATFDFSSYSTSGKIITVQAMGESWFNILVPDDGGME